MKKLRKKAEKKIWELNKRMTKLPIYPNSFTYIRIYQTMQELYFLKRYNLIIKLCKILINDM